VVLEIRKATQWSVLVTKKIVVFFRILTQALISMILMEIQDHVTKTWKTGNKATSEFGHFT